MSWVQGFKSFCGYREIVSEDVAVKYPQWEPTANKRPTLILCIQSSAIPASARGGDLDKSLHLLLCQVIAAWTWNPSGRILIGVTSGQRPGVKPWVQKATVLGKHQTRLQDYVAEKSGENKKRAAQ